MPSPSCPTSAVMGTGNFFDPWGSSSTVLYVTPASDDAARAPGATHVRLLSRLSGGGTEYIHLSFVWTRAFEYDVNKGFCVDS